MERNKGWTLTELMIVIVMMGIVIGISIPSFKNYIVKTRLDTAKNEILAVLRTARSNALSEQKNCQVIFETATNTYRISPGGAVKTLPEGIEIANSFDITYEFHQDRTALTTPCNVNIVNVKNDSVTFYLIPATGYIEVQE
ncbi:MAG: prepilin-type N-terminal cleavage/methylation domain-containing protein [bacterium]|nr:prepilin-type N-terminal cleavage/methylation domain-containing protein [bacterium]